MTADKREALLGFVRANCATVCLRLLRLEENTMFRIDDFRCSYPNNNPYGLGIDGVVGRTFTGAQMMYAGLVLPKMVGDCPAVQMHFVRE